MCLERRNERLQGVDRQVHRAHDTVFLQRRLEHRFHRCFGKIQHHAGVHLHEATIAVPCEGGVTGALGQPSDRDVIESEVEDRIHHPGHRDRRTGPHGDEQGIAATAEFLARGRLDTLQRLIHLSAQA